MPAIVIKDYTWRQTSEFVMLNVPLRGHPAKVDLFVIDNYVKISFPPFILELFLWADIAEKESECTVTDTEAILLLRKIQIGQEWPSLDIQNIDNETRRKYRNRALERFQADVEERERIKSEKRQCLQKEAVKEQISINTATLNKIEAIRDAHRKEAMEDFENWRSKAELPFLPDADGQIQENRKAYKPPLKWFKDDNNTLKSRPMADDEIFNNDTIDEGLRSVELKELEEPPTSGENVNVANDGNPEINEKTEEIETERNFFDGTDDSSSEDSESPREFESPSFAKEMEGKRLRKLYAKKRNTRPGAEFVKAVINGELVRRKSIFEEPSRSVPLPRRNSTINVTFTDRKFPTPARESSHLEEQEWLEKQAEARRKVGFDTDDLRLEERDPQWLNDKGDEFLKVGNYLAAISAYTCGIKISDKMVSLYANRSAAQYALGNYRRCIEDCSKALELMVPKCEGNRESRARCHARRGAALCKLSSPQHGIPELEAALKLMPDDKSIQCDLLAAKQHFDVKD
ncbi:dynein axonemal assembly factor 4-like [Hylaeus volcanicus]|uniref:dynein axonemal assembly factor 4-like n=1 Tax=Hylaeus volcanicus TaxID=313075 RepID=UPI0023B85B14|nr:dynein axonemal assembly factor 4-like [Hylaeus volcanicus]